MKLGAKSRPGSTARAIGGIALAIGLAACAASADLRPEPNSHGDDGHVPTVANVPQVVASADLRLPLDRYQLPIAQLHRHSAAQRVLVRRCMRRFGVQVKLPEPPAGLGPRTWTERRYGLTDAAGAASMGYGLGRRDPRSRPGGRSEVPELGPRALAVLTGEDDAGLISQDVPLGGCAGEAQRALAPAGRHGGQAPDAGLAQQLSLESFQRSQRHPRVRAVFDEWSECMRAEGHEYDGPLDPPADPRFQDARSAEEIDTARDDVACKERTNLVGIWYAVEAAHQRALIDEHPSYLEALAAANVVTSRRVNDVLRDPLG